MKRRFLTSILFVPAIALGVTILFADAPSVYAQVDTGLAEVGETVKLGSQDPRVIVSQIINIALGLVGIVLVSLIIYAGFLYMTSGGDVEKVDKAKKMILSAVIGLIIILSAWAIARFVIERLLEATGGGGGTSISGGTGTGGGFGGSGVSNVFQVKSITPQGNVPIRNVQVKFLFSRPIDDKTASSIVITKDGGTSIGGTLTVNGALVTFVPADPCPAPNQTLKCFDADTNYTAQVGSGLRSTAGQSIVCGGFAPSCIAKFHTGNLIDTTSPSVSVTNPLDGQAVPADSLVALQALATDDSGIAYVEFTDNGTPVESSGPNASSTVTSFTADVQWNTAGIPLQSVRQIAARAFDIDDHDTQSASVGVVVRGPGCFNGVQDGDETGVDCGGASGTPGFCGACSGGACTANVQCASGVCQAGVCVEQPTVTSMSPQDGKPGTFVTLSGVNFGSAGSVVFLGGVGDGDDKVAVAPDACVQAGVSVWSPTSVIVAVPEGAAIGPVRLTNSSNGLADASNDTRGPKLPDFVVNDANYPGLCALSPSQGFVGDQFKAVGQGFGSSPSAMTFGTSPISSFSSWTDAQVVANVPVVGTGKHAVKIMVAEQVSNPVLYQVLNKATAGPPTIASANPSQGPKGEYITLLGTNFGHTVGTVRFKNKLNGQDALGDTAFPAACAAGFWSGTNVIVKVPQEFLNKMSLTPGDYTVRVIRSDNTESNAIDFTVTATAPKPGLCAINPTVGPIGTSVTLTGERFGSDTGNITFYNGKAAISGSWTSNEIKSTAPTGAVTGPVTITAQGVASNPANFQVRNCNEEPGICSQSEQCCGNGTCIPAGQSCGAVSLSAMFAWQSSTGLIPVSPRVVEECSPEKVPAPIPSPAPWDARAGGSDACVTATITARFTTHLEPTTVTKANFKLKKCTSASNQPCATTEDVTLGGGFPLLQPASIDQDLVLLQPNGNFESSTTYVVEILTGVKGLGVAGANMEENPSCGQGVAYCFRFKTRASQEGCKVGAVSVSPHPYELNDAGAGVSYLASPLSLEDKCVVLQCRAYDWDWEHGDDDSDGRAIFQTPLAKEPTNGNVSCRQVGVAVTETGNVPVNMNAIAEPDGVKGTGHLYVKFIPPKVQEFAPNCNLGCINALIWARFNVALDPDSIAGNVEVRQCANENCVISELGSPLPIPQNSVKLTTVPKSAELVERFLRIEPVKPGALPNTVDLLLQPGKYYRVLLRGGTDQGIKGLNGVPMTGLNDPDGFVWMFRTKLGTDAFCTAESVDVAPIEKYETQVGERQLFQATAYGKPDECSAVGQALVQTADAGWKTSDALVADLFDTGSLDTGGSLPPQCSPLCLKLGSQGVFGKVAVCGNGVIETTDAAYCATGKTPYGDSCVVLAAGAKAGEQCDPGVLSNVGQCDPNTCLWKPIGQVPNGTCGNGNVDQGEACDFGRTCGGATATSTTPEGTDCTSDAAKTSCETNGGTCAPRQFRGCSPFCRHTGSSSAGSTCGNGDIADGEDCDDGNLTSNDSCSSQCLHTGSLKNIASVCGNAVLEPGEACEKANVSDTSFPAGCDAKTCLHTGSAQCDNDPSTTNVNCCGNAQVDGAEDCDDGNKEGGDGCSASCLLEGSSVQYPTPSFCSDGILGTGEQCEANVAGGDGIVDNLQLAYIVGDADPDEKGLMSSKISATLDGKTGDGTYGLQCGFTDETSCKAGYGLTDKGCCNARPALTASYPGGVGVCRNVLISATFNVAMNQASVLSSVQIAKAQTSGSCPAGTVQVADDFRPMKGGIGGWIERTWLRVASWWTGNPALAAVWCRGSVTGSWVPKSATAMTSYYFKLDAALEANTMYRVKFLGDNSNATDGLSDNATLANRIGVKTSKGVVAPYDASVTTGPLTFSFTTGADICTINLIQVTDTSQEHPLLFLKKDEAHPFEAEAVSLQNGQAVPIVSIPEYGWEWFPWTTSKNDIVQIVNPQPNQTSSVVKAENKNGNAFVVAWLTIKTDTISTPPTTGITVQGTAPVTVLLCENPWPNLDSEPLAPFRDKQSTGDGKDSSLTNTIFENGPYFNFSTTYCRDAGAFGTDDDLPKLVVNNIPHTSVDTVEGILRQYLFTYGDENKALKKDGIGVRIAANPLHLAPEDWYAWRGFGGDPKPVIIDGYRALRDGTTTYISAANTENPGKNIYSNIYLISHNPDAAPVTIGIYDQMVQNLAFNINLTQGVSNVCEIGNDPNLEPAPPVLGADGKPVSCSNDFECLKLGDDFHCGAYKLKLSRDTVRVADFQLMSRTLEAAKAREGTYPKLTAGTFLQSFSTTRWPSWDEEFSKAMQGQQPKDPVNQFLTCGSCSQSKTVCGTNVDCPNGQTCLGVKPVSGTFESSTSTEPFTCFDVASRKYVCPRIGNSPSRIYQYRSVNGGVRYELGSEFEVPPPVAPDASWWSPPLTTEIKRCTNAETLGFLCDVDADCRPCPNPKDMTGCPVVDFPITNGACRVVGGRFVYKDVCTNVPYGQSGTCGDGVIGQACSGGSNSGNACIQDTDCPGGSCSASELCEIGQTSFADCKTTDGEDGLKLQTCNECKEYVDDVNISQCNAGLLCGNGRIDRKCNGGVRNDLACLSDDECKGNSMMPDGVCGPTNETCDDGLLNGTYGHCNITCNGYAAYCGDLQISPGETCDAGAMNGEYCGATCDVNQSCGVDCKSKAPYCGDAIITSPEQCDGQTQTTVLAICTAGTAKDQPCATDADCGEGGVCADSASTLKSCQNVTINRCATVLKQCVTSSYASASHNPSAFKTCQAEADCAGESGGKTSCRNVQDFVSSCTTDAQCSISGVSGACVAYPTAHVRTCNAGGADMCTYTSWSGCQVLSFCGDGVIDKPSEACDDGAQNGDTKACTSSCKKNVCGDGRPHVGVEECDAGAQNGTITCSADYNSTCASCSTQCKFLSSAGGYCGDSVKNGPEQCDGMVPQTVSGDQVPICGYGLAYTISYSPSTTEHICSVLNADCLQTPCIKTKETDVTCQSLGYDFATSGVKPRMIALSNAITQEEGPCFQNIKSYEASAFRVCLGIACQQAGSSANYTIPNPLPSANEFWKCVKEKGPSFGAGIETDQSPQLVQCGASCSFTGCGKCSDEAGTGTISGQLIDAVYNQVVPQARVSVFYKGVLVKQASSNDDGRFTVQGLNDRQECSQYKIVVDKYDNNPCTENSGRPNCGLPLAPDWPYSYNIDEGARGGYWPLTSPGFSVESFASVVSPQTSEDEEARIYLFPRPGVGEAYFTVLWDESWNAPGMNNHGIWGGYNNHLIFPENFAFTKVAAPSTPTTCDYDNPPTSEGNQCVRDITWRTKGSPDLNNLPYAQLICLHQAGEIVDGYTSDTWNGCPVEGVIKCVEGAKPGDDVVAKCRKGTPNNPYEVLPPCLKEWWDTCDFYKDGPLTTYFRYAAFTGSTDPLRMYWGDWRRSVHATLNSSTSGICLAGTKKGKSCSQANPSDCPQGLCSNNIIGTNLASFGYKAVVSTDKQIVELDGSRFPSAPTQICTGKDCKFWHLADLNPTDGTLTILNRLESGRPEAAATYEYNFQGVGKTKKYCRVGSTLYKQCTTAADCSAISGATCTTVPETQWSKANY